KPGIGPPAYTSVQFRKRQPSNSVPSRVTDWFSNDLSLIVATTSSRQRAPEVATPSSQRIFTKVTGGEEKTTHDDSRNRILRITGVLQASESLRSTISPLRSPWSSSFTTAWKLCFGLSTAATSLFHKDINECLLEHVGCSLRRLRPAEGC